MMFDISREATYQELFSLRDTIADSLYPNVLPQDKVILVVGNKLDLEEEREVSETEGHRFAEETEARYIEISAKSGMNLDVMRRMLFF